MNTHTTTTIDTTNQENDTMSTTHNITPEQAIAILNRVREGQQFANIPALLPVVHVETPTTETGPFRLTVQGIRQKVAVWQNDASTFAKLYADAAVNEHGARILPVLLTATQGEDRVIEGHMLRGYYNLNAKPMPAQSSNPFKV